MSLQAESRKYSSSRVQLLWADGWFLLDARFRVIRRLDQLVLSHDDLMQVIAEAGAETPAEPPNETLLKELGL